MSPLQKATLVNQIQDRRVFILGERAFARFERALDRPSDDSRQRLELLLARPKRWK
ncbi:MAG: hypothetical protein P4L87_10330 [Formivibrio sp.]|nr:hypothetical protein [Formivibrio sp.]